MINREGYFNNGTERQCTNCNSVFRIRSKTVTLCGPCNSSRVKGETSETKMYRRARQRATSSGLEFNLEKSDIIIPEFCPVLGLRLEVHKGSPGGRPESPALDRKDPTKGYTKENIWVVSHLANMMKSNASKDQLKLFASWINSQDW